MRIILAFTLLFISGLQAKPLLDWNDSPASVPDSKLSPKDFLVNGRVFFDNEKWEWASECFYYLHNHYPTAKATQEAYFYLGVCQYWLEEYAEANLFLSKYLNGHSNPEHFRKAIETKYAIAEKYRHGAKKRAYDSKKLPKMAGAELDAIEIYDEITASLPFDDLAIKSYYAKGLLLFNLSMYPDAVTTLQTLIRRFPKHEIAVDSYVLIQEIFLKQSSIELQNTDILELARINLRHFEQEYPKESRVEYAKGLMNEIEECFATALYDVGSLYERKGQTEAAVIYYFQAICQFPKTELAQLSFDRIKEIAPRDIVDKTYAYMSKE